LISAISPQLHDGRAPILESDGGGAHGDFANRLSSDLDDARRQALALTVRGRRADVTHALGGADPATLTA